MTSSIRRQQGGSRKGEEVSNFGINWLGRCLIAVILACLMALPDGKQIQSISAQSGSSQAGSSVFLPAVTSSKPAPVRTTPLIHIPFFNVDNVYSEAYSQMAVFWFGKVSPDASYSHVRIGYNPQRLSVEVNTNDRQLWYDTQSPSASEVASWDAVSLYFHIPATSRTGARLLRLDAQMTTKHDNRLPYQAAFERTSSGWRKINLAFETRSDYLGGGVNGDASDKGWIANFEIPFSSLGLGGAPASHSEWLMGVRVYDQDTGPGGPTLQQMWPAGFSEGSASSYATVTFGYPAQSKASMPPAGSVTIKQTATVNVPDGAVGGGSLCGAGSNYWSEWGSLVYDGEGKDQEVVIQNQRDVSDFPCFSRYYVTFPLGAIPPGKVIVSARLTLAHFGNSSPADAQVSFIHVNRVKEGWSEASLSWNNSPPVFENYPGIWVDPLRSYPGVPGVPRTWDVTQALIDSLRGDSPNEMRLVLQSGDWAIHSGKYFWSSETAGWSSQTPPTLVVQWANP